MEDSVFQMARLSEVSLSEDIRQATEAIASVHSTAYPRVEATTASLSASPLRRGKHYVLAMLRGYGARFFQIFQAFTGPATALAVLLIHNRCT